jgi:pentatricopeptide repeat protein
LKKIFYRDVDDLIRRGRIVEARQAVESYDGEVSPALYELLISGYYRHKMVEAGQALYRKLTREGHIPTIRLQNTILKHLVYNMNMLSHAYDFYTSIQEPNEDTISLLIVIHSRRGNILLAREIFDSVDQPPQVMYEVMIRSYKEHNNMAEALAVMKMMVDQRMIPNQSILSHMERGYRFQRDTTKMQEILQVNHAIHPSVSVYTFNSYFYLACCNGSVDQAEIMFKNVPHPNDVTYGLMYLCYMAAGMESAAEKIANECTEKTANFFSFVITANMRKERFEEAWNILDVMTNLHGIQPDLNCYNSLVRGCYENNFVSAAEQLFETIPDNMRNHMTYAYMIQLYFQNQMFEKGEILYELMYEKEVYPLRNLIYVMMKWYFGANKFDGVEKLYNDLEKRLSFRIDLNLTNYIMEKYADAKNLKKVLEMFDGLEQKNRKTYIILIHAYLVANRVNDAMKTLRTMWSEGFTPSAQELSIIIHDCRVLRFPNLAVTVFDMFELEGVLPTFATYKHMIILFYKTGEYTKAREWYKKMGEKFEITPAIREYFKRIQNENV